MTQGNLFKGRDRRKRGWFWMDNDYLNGYAKVFGAIGTAIYVSLCRHADNDTQKCFPAMELMAEELGVTRNTISKYLKLFEKHHLIAVEKERHPRTKKWLNNVYTLLDKEEWSSHAQPLSMDSHAQLTHEPCTTDSESHAQLLGNKETHSNKTHIKETHIAGTSPAFIGEVIKLFEGVDAKNKTYYGNTTQRRACSFLIGEYGMETVLRVVEILPETNKLPYFPSITSPYELKEKWSKLGGAIAREKKEKDSKLKTRLANVIW